MTYFSSVPDGAHLIEVFKNFQMGAIPLTELHDEVLRGESELTIAERELIAAYVSAQNDCQFCYNAHKVYAEAFGISEEVFDALIADVETAPIDDKLKPIMRFAGKLTVTPSRMVQADVDAVFEAGWSEEALHTTTLVTATFNFMNRIIFAHGLGPNEQLFNERREGIMASTSAEEREARNESEIGSKPYLAFAKQALGDGAA